MAPPAVLGHPPGGGGHGLWGGPPRQGEGVRAVGGILHLTSSAYIYIYIYICIFSIYKQTKTNKQTNIHTYILPFVFMHVCL